MKIYFKPIRMNTKILKFKLANENEATNDQEIEK